MIALGLLVLLAAGGLALSGITARDYGAGSPARSGLAGNHLPGRGSSLFFGLVFAAAAVSGLARMAAGLGRGVRRLPASQRLPQAPPGTDRGH